MDRNSELRASAQALIKAWEALPEGHHAPVVIQRWLVTYMAPAVKRLRNECSPQTTDGSTT